MKTLKEKIEVMQAALDGGEVERRVIPSRFYCEAKGEQTWDWAYNDYRIKPKPLEFWVNVYEDGEKRYFDDKDAPTLDAGGRKGFVKTIKVREVTE